MLRCLATILLITLATPLAFAQDEHPPPPELDPGQVILPRDPDREPQREPLEIGRRTTFFDGPLREDGTVDYIAALNAHFGEGVTLDNNAFVELILLMPTDKRQDAIDALTLEALGLPPQREDEDACYITWDTYAEEHGVLDPIGDDYYLRLDNTVTPDGLRWLEANRAALDRVVAATRRPRYWAPMVTVEGDAETVLSVYLPHLGYHRELARALQARIYDRADSGQPVAAVADILALRRLAALQRHDPTLIGAIVAISIDALILESIKHLLDIGVLDEDALNHLVDEWDNRVALVPMSEQMNIGERCTGIDLMQHLWMGRLGWFRVTEGFDDDADDLLSRGFQSSLFDINQALLTLNHHYDREVQLMRIDDFATFQRFRERWEAEYDLDIRELRDNEAELAATLARVGLTRQGRTEFLTKMFINIMMPALGAARRTEFRYNTHQYAVYLAIQCERYRLATGGIPASLDALVPDYLDEVPIDPIDGQPMRYRTTDAGFVVYSIGTDLEDNGGLVHDFQDGGDIAVGVGIDVEPDDFD
ncbi:MAG: hypothetical protein ACIAXF_17425 [Phycisphaerales bacterium JB063]